ncbi:MAG: hypothetical protein IJH63_00865 [Methanobrevibacter sp.]|nr:hypothetical protein [Methanosphaera sp.]MBR0369256.1 hypothetical protein [Methanobrevibacter sp.]
MERYHTDLENNHHYILIDEVNWRSYYTPKQDDAIAIASKLNQYEKIVLEQRERIRVLEKTIQEHGLTVESEVHNCSNCEHRTLRFSGDLWCEVNEKLIMSHDSCNRWEYGE